ncbi:MAG: exodeoxyribonuclease III [Myxococcota bacterium]
MKLVTWNINSARAREERLVAWLSKHQPDAICLQELKLVDEAFPREPVEALGYHCTLFGQKTYNGVAILSKEPPEDVHRGLEDDVDDPQSRLVSARISGVHVLSAYFPNGGNMGSDKWEYKLAWFERLRAYLDRRFTPEDDVALCGDYNVAPFPDDVSVEDFEGTVLANPQIRAALDHIRDFGLVDVFRPFHPAGGVYSWWDYRAMGFERNHGLRIDHVYCTRRLAERVIGAIVDRSERRGKGASDHAPVVVEIE